MGFLTKCPISAGGVLSTKTGCSVLQAFSTSTSLGFMAQLVCRSWGRAREGRGMLWVSAK